MKKLITLTLLPLAWIAASASEPAPQPLSTITFRGEELPLFALPRPINPKKAPAPHYPRQELAAAIEGQAVLMLLVDTQGKVAEVEIVSSEPTPAFGEAARAAARKWRFEPLLQEGRPTKFLAQQEVNFRSTTTRHANYQGVTMPLVPERFPYYEGYGRTP